MNKKWNEKTTFEKVLEIISVVALCIWLIFEVVEMKVKTNYADLVNYIAVCVVCLCQAILFWKVKRSLSYIAIAGVVLMIVSIVFEILLAA